MIEKLAKNAEDKMSKSLEHLAEELNAIRSSRANATLLDSIRVDSYGSQMQIKQLASITVPDARTILVTPWDKSTSSAIEKAISEDEHLGLTPNNDGNIIRLNIPPLTEQRRTQLTKLVSEKVEACKVSMRSSRHEVLSEGRDLNKAKKITEDDIYVLENKLNKLIEEKNKQADTTAEQKNKELMEI